MMAGNPVAIATPPAPFKKSRRSTLDTFITASPLDVLPAILHGMTRRTLLGAIASAPLFLKAQSGDGFTSLFDGKTLSGWNVQDGPETAFYVDDGAIVV